MRHFSASYFWSTKPSCNGQKFLFSDCQTPGSIFYQFHFLALSTNFDFLTYPIFLYSSPIKLKILAKIYLRCTYYISSENFYRNLKQFCPADLSLSQKMILKMFAFSESISQVIFVLYQTRFFRTIITKLLTTTQELTTSGQF